MIMYYIDDSEQVKYIKFNTNDIVYVKEQKIFFTMIHNYKEYNLKNEFQIYYLFQKLL